jgi:predicted ferric reductase
MDESFEHPAATRRSPRLHAPVYRGLPASARLAACAVFAVAFGVVIGASFPTAMRLLGSSAAVAPEKLGWYGARVTGFLAYFALAASVLYGLLLSTRLLDAIAHRPVSLHLHKELALAGLGLSALHGLLLLPDPTFRFTPAAIAIPFASPYAPEAVGLGQLGFYLVAIITTSFYVRHRIGERSWRLVHYLTFVAFVGVTAHGIAAGSDTAAAWGPWLYLVPGSGVVFLFSYRLVVAIAERRATRRVSRTLIVEPGRRTW